jgi:Fe2+ transport system protein B
MSKKTNTLLFILGGTVFNILVTIISFVVFLAIFSRFYAALPESAAGWAIPAIFVLSIVVSFVVYRVAIKIITKKVDMEKYFDPLFGPRRPPRKN